MQPDLGINKSLSKGSLAPRRASMGRMVFWDRELPSPNVSREGRLDGNFPPRRSEYKRSLIKFIIIHPPKLDKPNLITNIANKDILYI